MTATHWITLGVALTTLASTWAAFFLRRLLQSVDAQQAQIAAIWAALPHYVKREVHDVANAELAAHMDKLRIEAQDREGRILNAIENAKKSATDEIHMVRGDVGKMHDRIDRIRDSAPERPRRS